MRGCVFKRKLKTSVSWGYLFSAGKDGAGKRNQIFKSGFATKGAAQSALRDAITEYETKCGHITEHVDLLGRRTWGYVLGDQNRGGASREAAERREWPKSKGGRPNLRWCPGPSLRSTSSIGWTNTPLADVHRRHWNVIKELGRYLAKHSERRASTN